MNHNDLFPGREDALKGATVHPDFLDTAVPISAITSIKQIDALFPNRRAVMRGIVNTVEAQEKAS